MNPTASKMPRQGWFFRRGPRALVMIGLALGPPSAGARAEFAAPDAAVVKSGNTDAGRPETRKAKGADNQGKTSQPRRRLQGPPLA
ncbi:MAG TPA: hypothetical protein VGG33_29390, partial [Polyangia bacterium]